MDQTFRTIITVLDKATAPLRAINQKIAALAAPVKHVGLSLSELGEVSGLTKLGERALEVGKSFKEVGRTIGEIAAPLAALGAAGSAAGLIEIAKHAAEYGAQLHDAAIKTGVAADELARLHYAASLTGTETEGLDKGLGRLNRTIGDALAGKNQAAAVMFQRLGIHLRDAAGHARTGGQVFLDLSEAVKKNESPILRAEIAATAFGGKMGTNMIPMLAKGRGELAAMGAEFDELHGGIKDGGDAAKEFEDNWRRMTVATQGVSDAIGNALFPVLTPLVKGLTGWLAANRALVATKVEEFVTGLAAAIRSVDWGGIVSGARAFFGAIGDVISFLGPVNSALLALVAIAAPLITGVLGLARAFLMLDASMLANPAGLIIIGLVALGAAAYELWQHWDSVWKAIAASAAWAWEQIRPIVEAAEKGLAAIARVYHLGSSTSDSAADPDANGDPAAGPPGAAPAAEGPLYGAGAPGAAGAAGVKGEVTVRIVADNLTPGTKVRAETRGDVAAPTLDVGYAWNAPY